MHTDLDSLFTDLVYSMSNVLSVYSMNLNMNIFPMSRFVIGIGECWAGNTFKIDRKFLLSAEQKKKEMRKEWTEWWLKHLKCSNKQHFPGMLNIMSQNCLVYYSTGQHQYTFSVIRLLCLVFESLKIPNFSFCPFTPLIHCITSGWWSHRLLI